MSLLVDLVAMVLFGAFAGWLTAQIMHLKTDFWGNALIGIAGSFIGSVVLRLLGGPGFTGFNMYSLLVAMGGACLFVLIVRKIDSKGTKRR
jgi:uncharacterized membrane protein YeaQ/YmgE (transglycosylase-associated protein family)